MKKETWKQKFIDAAVKTMNDELNDQHILCQCQFCLLTSSTGRYDDRNCDHCIQPRLIGYNHINYHYVPCCTHRINISSKERPYMWQRLIPMLSKVHGRHFIPGRDKSVFKPLFIQAIEDTLEWKERCTEDQTDPTDNLNLEQS